MSVEWAGIHTAQPYTSHTHVYGVKCPCNETRTFDKEVRAKGVRPPKTRPNEWRCCKGDVPPRNGNQRVTGHEADDVPVSRYLLYTLVLV